MDQWEYKYIKLYRAMSNIYDNVDDYVDQIVFDVRQAGIEGWDAVGQITMQIGQNVIPVIMFKRKIANSRALASTRP
jgi:hypothetical protein